MLKRFKVALIMLLCILLSVGSSSVFAEQQEVYHYYSKNLSGHVVYPEKVGSMSVSDSDVSINSKTDYGIVKANAQGRNVYVNAIGAKKMTDTMPDGTPIHLAIYKYRYSIKLPVTPTTSGQQIPQATHLMIQYWDGSNKTWTANKNTLEAALYWELNPWDTNNFGKIKAYTTGLQLQDTGVKLTPDTNWHTIELIANFKTQKYESMTIDGVYHSLASIPLCKVQQNNWGSDLSLIITTESMNCYPSGNQIFWWETYFKDLYFSELNWL